MSSPPREKGRTTRPRGSEEEFVLFLQGIPTRCRWQELKDLVRQTALHIRQAVVYDDPHGFPTGLGQIIVKNEEEAWRTYHRLSTNGWEGQSLVVMLARTSSPTRPIAGPTKSPSCVPPSYVAGYSTPPRNPQNMAIPPSPISAESIISSSPTYHSTEYGPVHSPMVVSHPTFVPIFTDPVCQPVSALPNSPALQPSFCDPMGFGIIPAYAMSHHMHQPTIANSIRSNSLNTSTPHKNLYNYSSPLQPTYPRQNPRRTLLIQNLNPKTTDQDLHNFLREAAAVENCEILPAGTGFGAQNTRYRASARVTIRSAEEAKRAAMLYNNAIFMDFKIRVKVDRSTPHTASNNPIPNHQAPRQSGFSSWCGTDQLQSSPPATENSCSDSEEQRHSHKSLQSEKTEAGTCFSPTNKAKSTDRCQPLVVNGSGIGTRTAVAI
ncbi:hypothetical protein BDW59DRAFT_176691 [Aspergillus cavernicola]|uniref:RRM domain-containing protein n=1 Tax=Aspergillus cavernicola TaxID=176166 RepID=A0ABR4HDR8_9EURO